MSVLVAPPEPAISDPAPIGLAWDLDALSDVGLWSQQHLNVSNLHPDYHRALIR